MNSQPGRVIEAEKEAVIAPITYRVCMHVHGIARTDGRVMRSATALVDAGYSVVIVDVERDMTRPKEEVVEGVTLKHLKLPYCVPDFTFAFLLYVAKLLFNGTLRLIQTHADIYHAHDVNALPAAFVAAFLRRKPLLFDAHEYSAEEGQGSVLLYRLHGLLVFLLRLLLPRCAGVITVSPPIAQALSQQYMLSEVTVIRNFPAYQVVKKTNHLREALGLSQETRIALYHGGLQPNRELDRLVRAAPFLEQNIVIVLMGQDLKNTRARLESLIHAEGVADRVKILQAVPYEVLLAWASSADIGLIILPLDYSLSIRWCLPNKLFEYLMAGLPVLTSPLEAVTEIVQTYDVGQVVDSLAPEDVAKAINNMLSCQSTRERMGANALRAAKEELCWEKETRRLLDLYSKVLSLPRERTIIKMGEMSKKS